MLGIDSRLLAVIVAVTITSFYRFSKSFRKIINKIIFDKTFTGMLIIFIISLTFTYFTLVFLDRDGFSLSGAEMATVISIIAVLIVVSKSRK